MGITRPNYNTFPSKKKIPKAGLNFTTLRQIK